MMRLRDKTAHLEYKKIATYIGILIFFSVVLIFTYSKTKNIWRGVTITIFLPKNGESISEPMLYLEGVAPRATKLTINGNNTLVGESGDFSYPIPIFSGYNEINIIAEDKFKNKTEKVIHVSGPRILLES